MTFLSAVRVALTALLVHKGRSALTALGIVIGTAAVIALVAAGEGARFKLDERMGTVGKNLILIRAGAHTSSGAVANLAPLKSTDGEVLRRRLGPILRGVAEVQHTQKTARTGSRHWSVLVSGTIPAMQAVREWKLAAGRYFTAEEVRAFANVCVLGETVRQKLFPNEPAPVGRFLRIDNLRLRVIGQLAPKGRTPAGGDQDNEVFVPITTLQRKLVGEERINIILTAVNDDRLTHRAVQEITQTLRENHHVKSGEEDFDVASVQEMAELAYILTDTLQVLVAIIASLSLVVGGIGIMNIMLVSVTERTREIGLRMALGATPGAVLTQFLIEATVLALAGGLIGISLGLGAAFSLAVAVPWPLVISPTAVLIAFGTSGAVGIFFGFYPAWKASRLDPIEALRYE
jgi:putative ABC transport system permease protein